MQYQLTFFKFMRAMLNNPESLVFYVPTSSIINFTSLTLTHKDGRQTLERK